MKIAEPVTLFINKNNRRAFFKCKSQNIYHYYNEIYGFEMTDEFNKEDYIILIGKDVIPFIISHNWYVENIINNTNDKAVKIAAKNSYIQNEIDTDLTIEDIVYDAKFEDETVTYELLHLWLISHAIFKTKYE